MGRLLKTSVIYGKSLLRQKGHVLFRPKKRGEQSPWRKDWLNSGRVQITPKQVVYSEGIPIPAFLFPEQAKMAQFKSEAVLSSQLKRHWGEGSMPRVIETIIKPFATMLTSIHAYSQALAMGFGIHGLYSNHDGRWELQSVHTLIPFDNPDAASPIPIVAASVKAPWNVWDVQGDKEFKKWKGQYWGIELALLIHAVKTFYGYQRYSLGEEAVSGQREGLLFPVPNASSRAHIAVQDLLRYLNDLDNPYLRSDANIFGIEIKEIDITSLGVFPNYQNKWLAYGFKIDGKTAEELIITYHHWMKNIFRVANIA